jgi:hypothetical protein
VIEDLRNWDVTCERFVAFLDIMGFRDTVFRQSHENVKKILYSLHPVIGFFEDLAKKELHQKAIKTSKGDVFLKSSFVYPISFSDSILLVSNDCSEISASEIFGCIKGIFNRAITRGIPIKGAIACGEVTADINKSIYFGKALIDAFDLQNELQLYGAVLHHTMEKYLKENNMIGTFERDGDIYKYPVNMKSCKITHYLVDWTYPNLIGNDSLGSVSSIYDNVSGIPRLYVDNTIEFVNWAAAKYAERKKKGRG